MELHILTSRSLKDFVAQNLLVSFTGIGIWPSMSLATLDLEALGYIFMKRYKMTNIIASKTNKVKCLTEKLICDSVILA